MALSRRAAAPAIDKALVTALTSGVIAVALHRNLGPGPDIGRRTDLAVVYRLV